MAKNTLGILIPDIKNVEIEVDIVGRTSLLVKRFDEKTQEGIAAKQDGTASRQKAPRNPTEECERARITDAKGQDCVKSIWFKKGMAAMGGYFGIPRGNVEQGVYVAGDLIPIKYSGKKPIMNTARVRVGQGGMAKTSLAYRPEFPGWSCKLRIGFDASVLTAHQVVSLLAHAGAKNGVGEWRPQKGGDYGRFDVFPAGASKSLIAKAKVEATKRAEETMAAQTAKEAKRSKAAKNIEVVDETPAKKKPGRPKKNVEASPLEDAPEAPAKRKPGRPKKGETNGVTTVANKMLRRPRKTDDLAEMVNNMTPEQQKQFRKKMGF
jgi:hypothetical protein